MISKASILRKFFASPNIVREVPLGYHSSQNYHFSEGFHLEKSGFGLPPLSELSFLVDPETKNTLTMLGQQKSPAGAGLGDTRLGIRSLDDTHKLNLHHDYFVLGMLIHIRLP